MRAIARLAARGTLGVALVLVLTGCSVAATPTRTTAPTAPHTARESPNATLPQPSNSTASAAPTRYTDPYHSVEVTPPEAVAAVAAIASVPQVRVVGHAAAPTPETSDLVASGPTDGALMSFYQVIGRDVFATVDAHDGHVASLGFANLTPVSASTTSITADQATKAAISFLHARGIAIAGLDMTVQAKNRGPSLGTFVVAWQRHVNGAAVPDSREVELLAASGLVFNMTNTSRPYADPPTPTVDRNQAITAAETAADSGSVPSPAPGARAGSYTVVSTELRVWFTPAGGQELLWNVELTFATNQGYDDAYWVSVDAMTGSATVTGRG
jgi:hypothetical protein